MNLNEFFTQDQRKRLDNLVIQYETLSREEVFEKLWKFTYAPIEAYINEKLGIMNYETEDNIKVRDYIFTNLKRKDIITVRRTISNDQLFRFLSNDKFAIERLENAIKDILSSQDFNKMKEISYCLNSLKDTSVLAGLKKIGLNEKEAIYYFDKAKEIFKYFDEKYEYAKQKKSIKEQYKEGQNISRQRDTLLDVIVKLCHNRKLVLEFINNLTSLSESMGDTALNGCKHLTMSKLPEMISNLQIVEENGNRLRNVNLNPDWIITNVELVSKILTPGAFGF